MPEIKIHEDPILQVAEIISVMAYPKDKPARYELEQKVAFSLYLDLRESLMNSDVRDALLAEGKVNTDYIEMIDEKCLVMCAALAPMLLDSESYEDSLKKAFPDIAFLLGQNVLQMFKFQAVDNTFVGRNRAAHYLADMLADTKSKFSVKSLDKAWAKYKPVAHLWAAYSFLAVGELQRGISGPYLFFVNCKEVLGLAIFFQEFLISYRSSNNRKIEFEPDEIWAIPSEVGIEKADVETCFSKEKELLIREWSKNKYSQKY